MFETPGPAGLQPARAVVVRGSPRLDTVPAAALFQADGVVLAAGKRRSRHRHFVAAAFVAGLAIAVLELACTGQVYALFTVFVAGSLK